MFYTFHFHPKLSLLRVRATWRGWEMCSPELRLSESIRLERLIADEKAAPLGAGVREGGSRLFMLESAKEYVMEYTVPLEGKLGERDFLLLSEDLPLMPQMALRGEKEIQLHVPQSFSALSNLPKASVQEEEGVRRYHFRGEGQWMLALARYHVLPFLAGRILLLEEDPAFLATRALQEAISLVSERFGMSGWYSSEMATLPSPMKGIASPGGLFVEKEVFEGLQGLPLLLRRFFTAPWVLRSVPEEEGYLEGQMHHYLIQESLKRVLSQSQMGEVGMKEPSALTQTRDFLGGDVFDKLLLQVVKKYMDQPLSREDFIREFEELSWAEGVRDFLEETLKK